MDIVKTLGLIFSVVLALAAGILTIGGGGDGVWRHEGVFHVSAPRTRVFEWLTTPEMREEWVGGLIDSKAEPSGWLQKGSRVREILEVDSERRERILEVTEIEDGTVFAYRTLEDGVEVEMRYTLSTLFSGGRSRINYTCQARYPGWLARVIEPILGHRRLSRMDEDFARLTAKAVAGD